MIPKIIHYCWFGGNELPKQYKYYMDSWKKFCPDYEIKEWNESNFDFNSSYYAKEAYEQKKWAFVSDYVRLKVIYEQGGIYLDTDVELVKPLDDLLGENCFLAAEKTGYVNTGLGFGAEKNNEVVRAMLEEYSNRHFVGKDGTYDNKACPKRNTKPLLAQGYRFSSDKIVKIKNATIFPPNYFDPMDYDSRKIEMTADTFSIHHYAASWITDDERLQNKNIDEIIKRNGYILGQIKKQKFLYEIQKEKGTTSNFAEYLISKICLKLNI